MFRRLFNPELFQGNLKKKHYFEGWYFKQVTKDQSYTFSFIPFMECNHDIVSVNHDLRGRISVNRNVIEFDGGKGYIEKDWGVSFPEASGNYLS